MVLVSRRSEAEHLLASYCSLHNVCFSLKQFGELVKLTRIYLKVYFEY